jgi:hypothetical protein
MRLLFSRRRRAVRGGKELGELAHAADDRARLFGERLRLVEDDLAFEGLAEADLELAQQDAVAVLERRLHHGHAVHLRAVLRLQVLDAHAVLVDQHLRMRARDAEVLEDDLTIRRAADDYFAGGEGIGLRGLPVLVDEPIH